MTAPPFHLAVEVDDLASARAFYGSMLSCAEGRAAERWVDFNFFGHQLTVHLMGSLPVRDNHNPVDGDRVPVPHFGVVLAWDDWELLAARVQQAGCDFLLSPKLRFAGEVGEQGTFFVSDPAGNVLEFKTFRDPGRLFAS